MAKIFPSPSKKYEVTSRTASSEGGKAREGAGLLGTGYGVEVGDRFVHSSCTVLTRLYAGAVTNCSISAFDVSYGSCAPVIKLIGEDS